MRVIISTSQPREEAKSCRWRIIYLSIIRCDAPSHKTYWEREIQHGQLLDLRKDDTDFLLHAPSPCF